MSNGCSLEHLDMSKAIKWNVEQLDMSKEWNCVFTYGRTTWAAVMPPGITVKQLRPRHGRGGDGVVKWWVWKDGEVFKKLDAVMIYDAWDDMYPLREKTNREVTNDAL